MKYKIWLPIQNGAPINTFNHHAAFLRILFTIENYYKYFYSDFINIWLCPMPSAAGFIMEKWYCDDEFFDMVILTSDGENPITNCFGENADKMVPGLLREENCIKNIKQMLSLGFYVSGRIDEYYVPKRKSEGRLHHRHDFYMNGYDDTEGCFYLGGYTVDEKYEIVNMPYGRFFLGLSELNRFNMLNFCRLKDEYNFEINISKIIALLEDYMSGCSSFENPSGIFKPNTDSFYYGIGVYDGLVESIVENESRLDIRVFRMLMEHKKCMMERWEVLEEAGIRIGDNIKKRYYELVNMQV